jgi:hypothetical protein
MPFARAKASELAAFGKSRADITLLRRRNVWAVRPFLAAQRQREQPFEQRELTVDLRVGRAGLVPCGRRARLAACIPRGL